MSVKPSVRRNAPATSIGAKQMVVLNDRRIVVVSGGPSSVRDCPAPTGPPAAPAAASPARKSRRFCLICIWKPPVSVPRPPLLDLRLQLALELVEEAPVGALGEERVGARADKADF